MSNVKTEFHSIGEHGVAIRRVQDVEDYIRRNIEDQNSDHRDLSFGRRVASIPPIIVEQWLKEGINIFNMSKDPATRKAVLRKLNDPDWRYLRTDNSRL